MEKDRSQMAEKVLQLTLEIIYLLTGEDNIVAEKTSGDGQNSIMVPLQSSLVPQRNNDQEILEVTKRIIDLLMGESENWSNFNVHIKEEIIEGEEEKEEDSMIREWEYLEGHKELMKENQPTLTSPDGSSNENPPERCPRPLYSRDSTQEDLIPHHHQGVELFDIKTEGNVNDEMYAIGNPLSTKENEIMEMISNEESSLYGSTGGHSSWNPPEEQENGMAQYSTSLSIFSQKIHHECNHTVRSTDGFNYEELEDELRHQRIHTEKPFSCSECGKSFMKKLNLTKHLRIHTNEKRFSCSECGKSFIKKSLLVQHQRVHSGKKPFSCSECGENFINKLDLVKHRRIHTGEKPFACSECEKFFVYKSDLVRHNKIHSGYRPFSCSECGKSFIEKSKLTAHQRVHTGEKPFSCTKCGKSFSDKGNCERHMKIHNGGQSCWNTPEEQENGMVQYSTGLSIFTQKIHHDHNHMVGSTDGFKLEESKDNLHTIVPNVQPRSPNEEKPPDPSDPQKLSENNLYPFWDCENPFINNHELDEPQRIHTFERLFLCPKCEKPFISESDLVRHQRIHTEKPFLCSECGKSFMKKLNLTKHLRIHTNKKTFPCSECGKSFIKKSQLIQHQRVHSGKKSFSCSECGENFINKLDLVQHRIIHPQEKPFSCSECKKFFMNRSDLVRHHKIHTGEKPFSCFECGKSFIDKSKLTAHMRVHTGEKPFSCSKCGKSFSDKGNCERHMKIHNGVKQSSCKK